MENIRNVARSELPEGSRELVAYLLDNGNYIRITSGVLVYETIKNENSWRTCHYIIPPDGNIETRENGHKYTRVLNTRDDIIDTFSGFIEYHLRAARGERTFNGIGDLEAENRIGGSRIRWTTNDEPDVRCELVLTNGEWKFEDGDFKFVNKD